MTQQVGISTAASCKLKICATIRPWEALYCIISMDVWSIRQLFINDAAGCS